MRLLIFTYVLMIFLISGCTSISDSKGSFQAFNETPEEALAIAAGPKHFCALLKNNLVQCYGDNEHNECNPLYARNADITVDASELEFSKISARSLYTCGILKNSPYKNIPVCFGEEGPWLDVPNQPVKDIATGTGFSCVIKQNDKIACVGGKVHVSSKTGNNSQKILDIAAKDLPLFGIDKNNFEKQDFSNLKFFNLKIAGRMACAQRKDNNFYYCMGCNFANSGEPPQEELVDFLPGDFESFYIDKNNRYYRLGKHNESFLPIANVTNPDLRKVKKITVNGLITAAGNFYDDNSPMPENLLLTRRGIKKEHVLDSVEFQDYSSKKPMMCTLGTDYKISCQSI